MIYDCNTHSCLWYFNFIAIPSFVCPKLAYIELLISLYNNRHWFADGFVIVRAIAMKFGWDKENVSCLKFRKFLLNATNFNRKLTMMFKLDLEKITLTAFRTPVQNGLMQKVNIFCTENEPLHTFYAPTRNRTNWMRVSCWFLFLKKIGHYFWRRVYIYPHAPMKDEKTLASPSVSFKISNHFFLSWVGDISSVETLKVMQEFGIHRTLCHGRI